MSSSLHPDGNRLEPPQSDFHQDNNPHAPGLPMPEAPLPEVIHTARLILRPWRQGDLDDIMAYATNPDWSRYLPVPQPYERTHAVEFIDCQLGLDRFSTPSWAIEHQARIVGGVNVRFEFNHRRGEIGYSLAPRLWGQGLTTEAAGKIIDIAFESYPHLRRMTAYANAKNTASLRVMEKLGMRREGVLRQHRVHQGHFVDDVICGILREEWEAARATSPPVQP